MGGDLNTLGNLRVARKDEKKLECWMGGGPPNVLVEHVSRFMAKTYKAVPTICRMYGLNSDSKPQRMRMYNRQSHH